MTSNKILMHTMQNVRMNWKEETHFSGKWDINHWILITLVIATIKNSSYFTFNFFSTYRWFTIKRRKRRTTLHVIIFIKMNPISRRRSYFWSNRSDGKRRTYNIHSWHLKFAWIGVEINWKIKNTPTILLKLYCRTL